MHEGSARVKVIGIAGWSGSGKTTLVVALLPILRARGLSVSTVKHAHDGFDMDRPGKDSFRHREAGAQEVLVASGTRWALLHELADGEPPLADLLSRLAAVDIVLVEGFKTYGFAKIEIFRPALGKPPIWPAEAGIVAVASDAELPGCDRCVLPLNEPHKVADFILAFVAARRLSEPDRACA